MRIYWHSTAPWSPSSYSVLTARSVPWIVRAGHEVTVGTWFGLQGRPMPWAIETGDNGSEPKRVLVLPHHQVGGNTYGEAIMVNNYEYCRADVCMTVCDLFVFPPQTTSRMNFAPWLPIDASPAPDGILDALRPAIYPMVYSRWGVDVLAEAGVKAAYVPASAPAHVFTPGDQQEARGTFPITRDYDFLVAMVAANKDTMDRKGFAEALQGFALFAQKRPSAMLYVHSDWGGPVKVGNIAHALGIEDNIIQCDQYGYIMGMLGESYMRDVYRAADVLLNPAKSEGFGLPIIEAQLCGCPVIATDFATTDELLSAGWKVGGQLDWYIGAEAWRMRVDVKQIADALEAAYQERGNQKLRDKARKGAVKFDTQSTFDKYWRPALRDIQGLIERSQVVVPSLEGLA